MGVEGTTKQIIFENFAHCLNIGEEFKKKKTLFIDLLCWLTFCCRKAGFFDQTM